MAMGHGVEGKDTAVEDVLSEVVEQGDSLTAEFNVSKNPPNTPAATTPPLSASAKAAMHLNHWATGITYVRLALNHLLFAVFEGGNHDGRAGLADDGRASVLFSL